MRSGCEEEWSLDMLLQDLRYAFRVLAGRPSFALVAALARARHRRQHRDLQHRLRRPSQTAASFASRTGSCSSGRRIRFETGRTATASPANLLDWKRRNRVFEDIAYFLANEKLPMQSDLSMMSPSGEPEPTTALSVSANLFSVLGVNPVLGRTFRPDEQIRSASVSRSSATISGARASRAIDPSSGRPSASTCGTTRSSA